MVSQNSPSTPNSNKQPQTQTSNPKLKQATPNSNKEDLGMRTIQLVLVALALLVSTSGAIASDAGDAPPEPSPELLDYLGQLRESRLEELTPRECPAGLVGMRSTAIKLLPGMMPMCVVMEACIPNNRPLDTEAEGFFKTLGACPGQNWITSPYADEVLPMFRRLLSGDDRTLDIQLFELNPACQLET